MSTYTPTLGLERITPGDQSGLWGNTTNNNLTLIDQAVTGVTPISFAALSGSVKTLSDFNGAADEARSAVLNITGIATGSNTVVIPNKQKMYLVRNNTGQDVIFRTASPSATYAVEAGNSILVFCDGNNNVFTGIQAPGSGTLSVSGGGTGQTTFGGGGFVKSSGGTNALTVSSAVALGSDVSGTLPVASGGTGAGAFTSGSLIVGNGTSNFGTLVGGGVGQVATWNGSTWTAATPATGAVSSVFGRTGAITAQSSDYSSFYANTVNPTFSTSVTSPIYNISGGGSTFLQYDPAGAAGIGFTINGTPSTKITASGTATPAVLCQNSAVSAGDQKITVVGLGYQSGMAPASVQCGAGGYGLTYTPGGPRLDILGGALSAYFAGSSGVQGNNSATWTTVSDQNLKTNIRSINSALAKLNALNPCHFEYKDKLGETQTGFIAQEFEVIFPGHVTEIGADDNYKKFLPEGQEKIKALDPNLIPYLVKAVQELSAKVDAQAAEIAALKAK